MDIRFPAAREPELVTAMQQLAKGPWKSQDFDAFGRAPEAGSYYFHRDRIGTAPASTLCMYREIGGHLKVHAIVPDEDQPEHSISVPDYVAILQDFDKSIATPAAESVGGITAVGTSKHRLEDHFSPSAIRLLEAFCLTSNAGDGGSHPSDQRKWMAFLIFLHRHRESIHCDIFGKCLAATGWWPTRGIPDLVHEYDFAATLLKQFDEPG